MRSPEIQGAQGDEDELYFTKLAALECGGVILCGHRTAEGDQPTSSIVVQMKDGIWSNWFEQTDLIYGVDKALTPEVSREEIVYFLGRRGTFRETSISASIADHQLAIRGAGYLMGMRQIQGQLFVVGFQNIVYRRKAGVWQRIDRSIFRPFSGTIDGFLTAVDGFSPTDVYAVGMGGMIVHWNGQDWRPLDSPTNVTLTSVRCASDGRVYVGGGGGIVLVGSRADGWSDLTNRTIMTGIVECIMEYHRTVYLGTHLGLYTIKSDEVQQITSMPATVENIATLDVGGDALWTAGDRHVCRYSNNTWECWTHPGIIGHRSS